MEHFYHLELEELRRKLVLMGEKAMDITRLAIKALEESDLGLVQRVLDMDDELDELELQIDGESIRYLSLRAPVATDVRLLTLCMKACHDLERVGDEACSIAKRLRRQAESVTRIKDLGQIPAMTEAVVAQLRNALDSFIEESDEKAMTLPASDRKIDDMNRANFAHFMERAATHPELVPAAIEMIFISKSLERIGDHAVNLGEEVVYLIKAKDVRHTEATRRAPESTSRG